MRSNIGLIASLVVGLFAQPLIAILKDSNWSTGKKTTIALVVSLILGLGIVILTTEDLSLSNLAGNIIERSGVVFTVANLAYNYILKGSGVQTSMERINILSPFDSRTKEEVERHEEKYEPAPLAGTIDSVTNTEKE